jgi:hypothetical protein
MFCKGVKKKVSNTSKSGIVAIIAPAIAALLPMCFHKTASPTAAPKTACVTLSIL